MASALPSLTLQVVTLSVGDLERVVEAAAARGYRQAAEERERTMEALADRLEAAIAAGGLKRYLTTREAGLYVGRSEDTVRRWIREGLPATDAGRGYLIDRDELDAWRTGEDS